LALDLPAFLQHINWSKKDITSLFLSFMFESFLCVIRRADRLR